MTLQEITTKATRRINDGRPLKDVIRFIDESIPLPDCPLDRAKAVWMRDSIKENIQALSRQTKTTGPSLTK